MCIPKDFVFDEKLTKWWKLAVVTRILIFDKIWRNWQTSGFVAKFLTKFALFDEQKKWHFWQQNPLEPMHVFSSLQATQVLMSKKKCQKYDCVKLYAVQVICVCTIFTFCTCFKWRITPILGMNIEQLLTELGRIYNAWYMSAVFIINDNCTLHWSGPWWLQHHATRMWPTAQKGGAAVYCMLHTVIISWWLQVWGPQWSSLSLPITSLSVNVVLTFDNDLGLL